MNYIAPWLYTTYKCNLACNYCYVKQCDKDMSLTVLDTITDRMKYLLSESYTDFVIFRVAGGEPLLVFDNWWSKLSEFVEKEENSYLSLISNFTKADYGILYQLRNYKKIGFSVSLDGYSFSKPYKFVGGSSSFDVMENLDKLDRYDCTDISTVLNVHSLNDIELLAKWIADRGPKWGVYLDHYYNADIDIEFLITKIITLIDVLYDNGYDVINNFKFNNVKIGEYDGCRAGSNLMAITTDGYMFDCQTDIYSDRCRGHISEWVPSNIKPSLPVQCADCEIKDLCKGGCALHNNFGETCLLTKATLYYILEKEDSKNA